MPEPIALCFSGGKDSCLALQELRRADRFEVVELVTTVSDAFDRVSMHGVRRSLLREQARSIGLPLVEVVVPPEPSNVVYEREMGKAFRRLRENGEFHTFVLDGPVFDRAIGVEIGEVKERDGFGFCDLLPAACCTVAAGGAS